MVKIAAAVFANLTFTDGPRSDRPIKQKDHLKRQLVK